MKKLDYEKFGKEFLSDLLDWIGDYFRPDDVFSQSDLEEWAADNGWVPKPEKDSRDDFSSWGYQEEGP